MAGLHCSALDSFTQTRMVYSDLRFTQKYDQSHERVWKKAEPVSSAQIVKENQNFKPNIDFLHSAHPTIFVPLVFCLHSICFWFGKNKFGRRGELFGFLLLTLLSMGRKRLFCFGDTCFSKRGFYFYLKKNCALCRLV